MAKKVSIQYLAGFFDGEGCIYAVRNHDMVGLQVVNTYYPVLKEYQKLFGGNITEDKRRLRDKKGNDWKPAWRWRTTATLEIKNCLLELIPFLVEKKYRAELALRLVNCVGPRPVEKKIRSVRKKLVEQISELNH